MLPHLTILVIEEDLHLRRYLRRILRPAGYRLIEAATAQDGLVKCSERPDAVLLDLTIAGTNSINVLKLLAQRCSAPILALLEESQTELSIATLDAGAVACVSKPFAVDELLVRIKSALRRSSPIGALVSPVCELGDLRLDFEHHLARVDEREIGLTPLEFRLLALLANNLGKVVSHRHILLNIWGSLHRKHARSLRSFIHILRRKLEKDPTQPRHIVTEPSIGYRLKA
jgi:two-component system KDP operon response regulator KdpE